MNDIKGKPHNINKPLVGLLKKKRGLNIFASTANTEEFALVGSNSMFSAAKAYVTSRQASSSFLNTPCLEGIDSKSFAQLDEGDIVLALPDGRLKILFDKNSKHNCIFTTNRCNLKCLMCPQPPSADGDVSIEHQIELIRLMAQCLPASLAITGGEATLLGDGLVQIVAACKQFIPGTPVIILTNGKRLKDFAFVKNLVEVKHPNLQFAIPLYSDDYVTHDSIVGVKGSFYETLKGIHNLALFGQAVEIRCVVLPQNADRLANLAEFIFRNLTYVKHVALMGMEVTGLALKNVSAVWKDPAEHVPHLESAVHYFRRVNMPLSIYNFQLCVLPEKLWPYCRRSISDWKNDYIAECAECRKKDECGGFFATSGQYRSSRIRKL